MTYGGDPKQHCSFLTYESGSCPHPLPVANVLRPFYPTWVGQLV